MCSVCSLLDNTWPDPKSLARTLNELPPDNHFIEIVDRVMDDADQNYWETMITEWLDLTNGK